jgi:hypothetical protein
MIITTHFERYSGVPISLWRHRAVRGTPRSFVAVGYLAAIPGPFCTNCSSKIIKSF